ncbi:hypothetical protein C8Q74DRAFT_1235040 [Fomes fomentarius]|nr:hypothetical protein C8Q74DRAFT_1235040 [Fomes fomentarius]
MSDDSAIQEIADAYPRLIIENYCIVASTALLWFDFALTFTTEVRRIWGRKFSGATLVFLFMRYTALLDRVFFLLQVLLWNTSDTACGGIDRTDDVLVILNYFGIALFTVLRVYGVWAGDWKPLILVIPLTIVKPILYIIENVHYYSVQAGPPFGCLYIYTLPDPLLAQYVFATVAKATTIAADAVLIALTWIKTIGISREAKKYGFNTPLATLLLRDGTAYFLVLLLIQIVSIISSQVGSSITVWLVWPYFEQVLTVIFLSRFMLDLRGLYIQPGATHEESTDGSGHTFSDIRFTTSLVVGNLGAPLSYAPCDSKDSCSLSPSARGRDGDIEGSNDNQGGHGIEVVSRPDPSRIEDGREESEWTEKERAEKESMEWYEDESPAFVRDPFTTGMKLPLIELRRATLGVAEVELQENKESPISPKSPESPQGSSTV